MSENTKDHAIGRRTFLGGASILGLGALGLMAGCSSPSTTGEPNADDASAQELTPDSTADCDILIIGAGFSGLAAAVQAGELDVKTIVFESGSAAGGNASGVEYTFGLEEGQSLNLGAMVKTEIFDAQFRNNGQVCLDLFKDSAENYQWLVDHGVEYEGTIPYEEVECIHHFKGGYGRVGYIEQMTKAAEDYGVEFMLSTKGVQLIKEGERVTGAFGEKSDGTVVRVNAKAVILATGGFGANLERLEPLGYDPDVTVTLSVPGDDGSGHDMAVAVGAKDYGDRCGVMCNLNITGLPSLCDGGVITPGIGFSAPYGVWVNEYGQRFVNEDFTTAGMAVASLPCRYNNETYIIMDSAMLNTYKSFIEMPGSPLNIYGGNFDEQLESGLASGEIVKADTVEDLGKNIKVDAAAFAQTAKDYNDFAAKGVDEDFDKDPSTLMPLTEAPFYAFHIGYEMWTTLGSVGTDRYFRAIDDARQPIEGLYAIGMEGSTMWASTYSFNIGGACSANNARSGRVAVKHAYDNLMA